MSGFWDMDGKDFWKLLLEDQLRKKITKYETKSKYYKFYSKIIKYNNKGVQELYIYIYVNILYSLTGSFELQSDGKLGFAFFIVFCKISYTFFVFCLLGKHT